MPARNLQAVRQRAIEAAHQRTGGPVTPSPDPVFVALNHSELRTRARSGSELAERVRRAEDYATLGARVVVELHSESDAIMTAAPTAPTDPTNPRSEGWLPMPSDPIHPDQLDSGQRFRADLVAYLDSLPVGELAELLAELPSRRQQPLGLGLGVLIVMTRVMTTGYEPYRPSIR